MKSVFAGLSFVAVALAIPFFSAGHNGQLPLAVEDFADYPGFDLDLNALRLVQLEGQDPVWMTELEKVGTHFERSSFELNCLVDPSESPRLQVLRHVHKTLLYLEPHSCIIFSTDAQDLASAAPLRAKGGDGLSTVERIVI